MTKPPSRRLSLLWLLCALAAALAGCRRPGAAGRPGAPGTERATDVLRLGNGTEPQDLDPQMATGVPEHRIFLALFEGLVTEDPHDLHPVPGQAESWEISPDGKVYTFHLRAGLRWSNGDPLTADDFLQSYRRILSPAFAAQYAYMIYNYVANAEEYYTGKLTDFSRVGFKAPDDRTVVVTLKEPTPFLLKVLASSPCWGPVPVKILAKFGSLERKGTHWTRAGNLVGNGPFLLRQWTPNQKVVVERNPFYWDAAAVRLRQIEFYPTDDLPTEERMFRDGQLDATYDLPFTKIDAYRRDHPEELRLDPWIGVYYLNCNVLRPPLNDKRVRRALALALDRESLVRNVARGGQEPALSLDYPGVAGYTLGPRLTENVEEAKRLLAEAGYPGGRGFPPLELLYNTYEQHKQIGEAVQAMWRKNLGINLQLRNEEWKVYLDAEHTHDYQLSRAGWISDYVDPQGLLVCWVSGSGNNFTQWSNAAFDGLFHRSEAAASEAERYALYRQMDGILADEMPAIPIFYYTRTYALSPRIKGWWPTLMDDHPWKYVYLQN